MYETITTDHDERVMAGVAYAMKEVGNEDDASRLLAQIIGGESPKSHLEVACEIAIAYMRKYCDVRNELEERKAAGYL